MLLGEISQIRTGLVLSRKKAETPNEVKQIYDVISLKDIDEYGRVIVREYESLEVKESVDESYLTREGDILMRLSYPYTVVVIDGEHEGLVIPSYFAIIRSVNEAFLTEYLGWYLGSTYVKDYLKNQQSGVKVSGTNKKNLEGVEIRSLPLKQQKRMIELYHYFLEEKDLLQELIVKKEQYYKAQVNRILGTWGCM